ncbi:MAG: endonuclease domain-containing protein [Gaiellaceae bacterium]
MATDVRMPPAHFDPASFETFRFVSHRLDATGRVELVYALEDKLEFVESIQLPVRSGVTDGNIRRASGLLALLHWVAGVSYFKTAVPRSVRFECGRPSSATARLLETLYSEGLGEFAYRNQLPLPHPSFATESVATRRPRAGLPESRGIQKVLVPVGGGKDSAVAIEIVRHAELEFELFSVGNAVPIERTASVAAAPRLIATRHLDSRLGALNGIGALNGHIPVTAIVSCIALLTAALNGFDAVAMANERSASRGNLEWDGVMVNHQFSKSLRVERMLSTVVAQTAPDLQIFSVLRPASELSIARAFARMTGYHHAFTSCNTVFRLDPALRGKSWCCDCPKCRFVFLALAPFMDPTYLRGVFGTDLLDDERQFDGFALLTATGGHKPFECVGEEEESLAAMRLLAADPRWRDHAVVHRFAAESLPAQALEGGPEALALSDDHDVPSVLLPAVREILGA